jgi:hypothetical protein
MIYINRFNLCFIRIPKNASSSVMDYIYSELCDETDRVSRAFEWDDSQYHKVYHVNMPPLPHSHVDARYAIENGIAPASANFYGIVRQPFERQLSLYLYRQLGGRYKTPPSIEEFRRKLVDGVLQDKPQQMQPQHTFLEYSEPIDANWWVLDNISEHLREFSNTYGGNIHNFKHLNRSPGQKNELVDLFYTPQLKQAVTRAYEKDFELYERTCNLHGLRPRFY